MDLEIAPEPTAAEREAIAALLAGSDRAGSGGAPSEWLRVAIDEGVAAGGAHEEAPFLQQITQTGV